MFDDGGEGDGKRDKSGRYYPCYANSFYIRRGDKGCLERSRANRA